METRFKGYTWSSRTTFENEAFEAYDFSDSNFDGVVFIGCTFEDCVFSKGTSGSLGIFACNFRACSFDSFDFRRVALGADGGEFADCIFTKCNFTGRHFSYPHFESCIFDRCKIKNVNFNDTSFRKTVFIGKIEDTTFNGMYHSKATGRPAIDKVDFARATLGDFVTFEDCDLSNSIPPAGRAFAELLYQFYEDDPNTLSTGSPDRMVVRHRDQPRGAAAQVVVVKRCFD
jgi:fluoroquinolone resistance protein